jgi:hypothetical protein
MQEMMRRICGNKFLMALVMLILVAGIVGVIWLRFFSPFGSSSSSSANATVTSTHDFVESIMPPLKRRWRRYV